MSEAIDEQIDPKVSAPKRLRLMKGAVVDWDDPECAEKWVEAGRAEVHAEVLGMIRKRLYRQAGERFDPETVERLIKHLDRISDPELLLEIFDQIHEGATCATLLEHLKNRS